MIDLAKFSIVKQRRKRNAVKEFAFYLDAWLYCSEFKIPLEYVTRRDWKTWVLKVPKTPTKKVSRVSK